MTILGLLAKFWLSMQLEAGDTPCSITLPSPLWDQLDGELEAKGNVPVTGRDLSRRPVIVLASPNRDLRIVRDQKLAPKESEDVELYDSEKSHD